MSIACITQQERINHGLNVIIAALPLASYRSLTKLSCPVPAVLLCHDSATDAESNAQTQGISLCVCVFAVVLMR